MHTACTTLGTRFFVLFATSANSRPCPAETGDHRLRGRGKAAGQSGGSEQVVRTTLVCEEKVPRAAPVSCRADARADAGDGFIHAWIHSALKHAACAASLGLDAFACAPVAKVMRRC
jgi:hypothetical protein